MICQSAREALVAGARTDWVRCASDWHSTSEPIPEWFGSCTKFARRQVDIQFCLVLDGNAVGALPVRNAGAIVRGAH